MKRWPRRWLVAAIVLAVVAGGAWWATSRLSSRPAATAPGSAAGVPAVATIMVLPLVVDDGGGGDASWARLGLMDFVGDRLRRAGLPVLPSESVLGLLRGLPGQTVESATPDPVRLGLASRARWVVASRASRHDGDWVVALVAHDRDGLRQQGRGRAPELLEAARLAADRLSAALGGRAGDGGEEPALTERLQRARAAMLANEIETARAILLAAPELQRRQPRLRYQLARVDFRAGDYVRGLATLDALLAGGEAAADARFRVQVLNARGAMLLRLDRQAEALAAYDEAVALAPGVATPGELGVALSGRAVAHSMDGRFGPALADLGRARIEFGNAGDALAVARVDANLGIMEIDRGRPAHGLPYLDGAVAEFAALGAVNELATARVMRLTAHQQLLRPDLALQEARRAAALLPKVRDPSQRAQLVLAQASALVEAGALQAAGRLLSTADARAATGANADLRARLEIELALRGGAPARAVALAGTALAAWPQARNPVQRAWLRLRREQAALDADLPASGDGLPAADGSVPGLLLQATVQRASGHEAAADAAYRDALARAEQGGVPEDIAAVAVAHGGWLIQRGRLDEASALVGRTAPWAARDFDVAVLRLQLMHALGRDAEWRAAYRDARAIAGDRPLPSRLAPPDAR